MNAPAIELRGVTKVYRDALVLDDVDLRVEAGEIRALVGLNGAGKTTIMRLLLGMSRPSEGAVLIRGAGVGTFRAKDWSGVGHLIETPLAYPELSVERNLWIAGRLAGMSSDTARRAARNLAEELILTQWWKKRARTLSRESPAGRSRGRVDGGAVDRHPRRTDERARPRGCPGRARGAAPPEEPEWDVGPRLQSSPR